MEIKKFNFKKIINVEELSIKEKLILATTLLILSVVVANFLYSLDKKNNRIESSLLNIDNMILNSIETTERGKFWSLNNIVNTFFSSYNLELNAYKGDVDYNNIKFTREDYYYILSNNYNISKNEYMEISKQIIEKFVTKSMYGEYIPNNISIDTVYLLDEATYGESMYLCQIKVPNVEEEYVYIGIKLNERSTTFSIFYLE